MSSEDHQTTVKVGVRIRPLLENELGDNCTTCVSTVPNSPQVLVGKDQCFSFDYVFGEECDQVTIFEECVLNLVDAAFEGFNATILAYGQTGSGKTYTMGSASSLRLAEEEYGIIPRVIQTIFELIQQKESEDANSTFRVRVQFLEIYGEELRDLLDPNNATKVTIREAALGGVYISGAREETVTSLQETMNILEKGTLSRTTGATKMNQFSSRSHAIFTMNLEHTIHCGTPDSNTNNSNENGVVEIVEFARGEPEVRKCKFHFVDLAGSERAKRTQAEGQRLKEGIDINKGLLVLGNVISALGDVQKRGKVHVPYRDSKLTRMLQDSLGGNSKTLMLCCVSPADSNYYESLNAIRYANRARNIQNKPVLNLDPTSMIITEMRRQIQILAGELLQFRCNPDRGLPSDDTSAIKLKELQEMAQGNKVSLAMVPLQDQVKVNGQPISMGNGTSKIKQLKFEEEISGLKQRCETSEMEVKRLNERVRVLQNQISDINDQLILTRSERDYYQAKSGDGVNDKSSLAIVDSSKIPIPDEITKDQVVKLVSQYIREIDDLKKQIAEQQSNKSNRLGILNSTAAEDDLFYGIQGPDTSLIEEELTTNVAKVISQTQEQLWKEEKLLRELESADNKAGESDDDNDLAYNSAQEEDNNYKRRQKIIIAEVTDITESIHLKEQLVIQLQRSQQQYEGMKLFYQEKLDQLAREVEQKEIERQKMNAELNDLAVKNELVSTKLHREEQLKEKLKTKDEELRLLRKKQVELQSLTQVHSRSNEQMTRLENEILSMKRQRVELSVLLQNEKKNHLQSLNQKVKEIDRLKRELAKTTAKVVQLGYEKELAQSKVREMIKESNAKRKRAMEMQGIVDNNVDNTEKVARKIIKKHISKPVPASDDQMKLKSWLERKVKEVTAREQAVEALRRQCETQLKLANEKRLLEESRASIRQVITQQTIDNNEDHKILTKEEEEALSEVEERIQALDNQMLSRNQQIERMESQLTEDSDEQSSKDTLELLSQHASNSHNTYSIIKLMFDMLVKVKMLARNRKDTIAHLEEREKRYREQLEEANLRLTNLSRQHSKELDRLDREFEEKLAGIINYSSIGQLLRKSSIQGPFVHGSDQEFEGTTPASQNSPPNRLRRGSSVSFRSIPHLGISPFKSSSNVLGMTDSNSSDRVLPDPARSEEYDTMKAALIIANEKNSALKEKCSREEVRIQSLERNIDDLLTSNQELQSELQGKQTENDFLEEECRALREIIEDFKRRIKKLEGGIGVKIIQDVRNINNVRRAYSSDDEEDDSDEETESVLDMFSSLGSEIQRTGSIRAPSLAAKKSKADSSGSNIFDRLTNPNYFTGTQKTLFTKDVEVNRAKVQLIKEGVYGKKKNEWDDPLLLSKVNEIRDKSLSTSGEEIVKPSKNEKSSPTMRGGSPELVDPPNSAPASLVHHQLSSSMSMKTLPVSAPPTRQIVSHNSEHNLGASTSAGGNVFTRLLNPDKFTGIHKQRRHQQQSDQLDVSNHVNSSQSVEEKDRSPLPRSGVSSRRFKSPTHHDKDDGAVILTTTSVVEVEPPMDQKKSLFSKLSTSLDMSGNVHRDSKRLSSKVDKKALKT